jgi:hypothetical protein
MIKKIVTKGLAACRRQELALRELLGEGAPLSASPLQRLKEKWQG